MADSYQKRGHPRIHRLLFTSLTAWDEYGESQLPAAARTLDLSEGGVRVEIPHAMPFTIKVRANIGMGDEIIDVDGEVVSLHRKENGDTELSLRFAGLSAEDKAKIKKMTQ